MLVAFFNGLYYSLHSDALKDHVSYIKEWSKNMHSAHSIMSSNMIHQNKKKKWKLAITNFINQLGHF